MRPETSAILRLPFPADDIDQLPRVYHRGKADERTIQLDYVGHATATARLLDADADWTWEPFAIDELGLPVIVRRGDALELWVRLTIDGTTRPGVGTVPVEYDRDSGQELPADQDTAKELIGDALRNAAMRFGVALDLWRKHDTAPAAPTGPPCPHCGAPVLFNDEKSRGRKPIWSCQNRGCGGGQPRDKEHPEKGNWPWGSYDADFFADKETGGELKVEGPSRPTPEVTGGFDVTSVEVSEDQARAELQAYKEHPGYAAGKVQDIRARVDRTAMLLAKLGEDGKTLFDDLWTEWAAEDPARAVESWRVCRAPSVASFARHVQGYLRAL